MNRFLLYLVLIVICDNTIGFSQSTIKSPENNCYRERIILNIRGIKFIDTTLLFRNYQNEDKRVVCCSINDKVLDAHIWESKYNSVYLQYQKRLNKFSILVYELSNKLDTIARYYWSDRKTLKAIETTRFKIKNKQISEINILPNVFDGFIPIKEFDNTELHAID
jgi:hypothetical protein